jgi:hypothetical protein
VSKRMVDLDQLLNVMGEIDNVRRGLESTKARRRQIMESMIRPGRPVELTALLDTLNRQAPVDSDLPARLDSLLAERKRLAYELVRDISNLLGIDPPWGPIKIDNHTVVCESSLPSSLMVDGKYVLLD